VIANNTYPPPIALFSRTTLIEHATDIGLRTERRELSLLDYRSD
jgi:hypothetical protein